MLVVVAALLSAPAAASAPAQMQQLEWMTGKTWSAAAAGSLGNVAHIDTRYEWSSTGNFVQFTTQFVELDGAVKRRYAGMFFYDPKDGVTAWYMDQDNAITHGHVDVRTDGMTMNLVQADGTYRVDIVRTGAKSYRWQLFAQAHETWVKMLSLDFTSTI